MAIVEYTKRVDGFSYEVSVSGHKILTDVPEALGGLNRGPDPHDLLVASLATCTAITVQMYANRKGFSLESVDVKIKITAEGEENRIHREIKFIGDLTAEQQQRLFTIAEKCPIHKFLTRGATVTSEQLT